MLLTLLPESCKNVLFGCSAFPSDHTVRWRQPEVSSESNGLPKCDRRPFAGICECCYTSDNKLRGSIVLSMPRPATSRDLSPSLEGTRPTRHRCELSKETNQKHPCGRFTARSTLLEIFAAFFSCMPWRSKTRQGLREGSYIMSGP